MGPGDKVIQVNGNRVNIEIHNGPGSSQPQYPPPPYTTHLPPNRLPNINPALPAGGNDHVRRGRRPADIVQPVAQPHNHLFPIHPRDQPPRPRSAHPPRNDHREGNVARARSASPDSSHVVNGGNKRRRGRLPVPDAPPRDPPAAASIGDEKIREWLGKVPPHSLSHERLLLPQPSSTSETISTESSATLSSTDGPPKPPFLYHYVALSFHREETEKYLEKQKNLLSRKDPNYATLMNKLDETKTLIKNFMEHQCVGWIDEVSFPLFPIFRLTHTLTLLAQASALKDPTQASSQDSNQDANIYCVHLLRHDDESDEACSQNGIAAHPNKREISGIRPLKFDAYGKIELPWDKTYYYHHWEDVLPIRLVPMEKKETEKKETEKEEKDTKTNQVTSHLNRYELSPEERKRFHDGSKAYFQTKKAKLLETGASEKFWEKRAADKLLLTMAFNPKFPSSPAEPRQFIKLHDDHARR